MRPGNIILLNGTPAAGKTALAKALQDMMDEPYLHSGNDQLIRPSWSDKTIKVTDDSNHPEFDGWLIVVKDETLVDARLGSLALQWLLGLYRALAAWSASGNHVIADVSLHEENLVKAAAEIFHTLPVWHITVYCPLAVAEQREKDDDLRIVGAARLFHDAVYKYDVTDFTVNTAENSPEACAKQIQDYLKAGHSPTAFRRLHEQLNH